MKFSKLPTKNTLLAIPVATSIASGFSQEELIKRKSHLVSRWVYVGMYVGTQFGASVSDMSHVFSRAVQTGHQGVNRIKARVTLNDTDAIKAVDNVTREVQQILDSGYVPKGDSAVAICPYGHQTKIEHLKWGFLKCSECDVGYPKEEFTIKEVNPEE